MNNRRDFLKSLALLGAAAALPVQSLLAQDIKLPKPMGEGRSTIVYGAELNRRQPPRKISIPDVGEYKVLKGDFHIHTLFSDGQVMPRDRVVEAADNGLDVIAITDHVEYRPNFGGGSLKLAENNDDFNRSYNLAKGEAEKSNLILIRGTEITKGPWHFNALFLNDVNLLAAVVNDWQAMIAAGVAQGGFIHWNHPSWVNTSPDGFEGLKKGEPMRFFSEIAEVHSKGHLHGIEVFNGTSFYPIAMDWCNEQDLAPMTNSDIHSSEWNAYGHQNPQRPMTLVLAKERSYDSIREAFFANRVVGWAANMIMGREPWVRELFRACIAIEKEGNRFTLRNRSDIPCIVEQGGTPFELPSIDSGKTGVFSTSANKLTVCNWFVGMNKPLEIEL